MAERTNLEHTILGIFAKFGPCTTYTVRRHFEGSPTGYFSGSTGSIYPAVRRLEQGGLLAQREDMRGRQRRRMFSITDAGLAELRAWLTPPIQEIDDGPPQDPLRTRFYFLSLLTPRQQRAFTTRTLKDLEGRLNVLQEYVDSYPAEGDTHISHLAARGSLYAVQAQIDWLRDVQDEL